MAIVRSLIASAILAGGLAGPAFAQQKPEKSPYQIEEEEKKKAAEKVDQQYRSTLDRTRKDASEVRVDPWSNMRGTDNSKTKR